MARHYKVVFVLGLFLLITPLLAQAQRAIGVMWENPASQMEASNQLHKFSKAGFSYLQVNGPITKSSWELIGQLGFKVYAELPIRFPIKSTFLQADSAFCRQMSELANHYQAQHSVRAIGLFSYGQTGNANFQKGVNLFIKKVARLNDKKLYYITTPAQPAFSDSLFDFKVVSTAASVKAVQSNIGAWIYHPPKGKTWKLKPVKHFLKVTGRSPNIPVFFRSAWLQTMNKKHPQFWDVLSLYATSPSAVFPLPQPEKSTPVNDNIIVIALLAVWILFGIASRYDPLFQPSFYRYFFSHKFYADDVVNRKIRTFFSGYSILIQHCLAGGIIYYCTIQTLFTDLGRQALFSHIPVLSLFGTQPIELFFWGVAAVLVIEVVSTFVLFFTNSGISHINQAINLYCWPLQLNLFTATIAAIFFLTGSFTIPMYVMGSIFLLLLFGSFAVAAKNIISYLTGKGFWIFGGFSLLYFIILFGFIVWLYSSTIFPSVIQLAASLS